MNETAGDEHQLDDASDAARRRVDEQLQVTMALTEPGRDFTGGENLFLEQRPHARSRGHRAI